MLRRELIRAIAGLGFGGPAAAFDALCGRHDDARSSRRVPGRLRAGVAKLDITPEKPLSLDGYENPETRVSVGVHDRLYARAFAFSSGTSRLVLVSCDLTSFPLGAYFQRAITERFGLGPDELWLCAIHTHSGPLLTLNPSYPDNLAYTKSLEKLLPAVVGRALRSMSPVRLAIGRGRSSVGVSRRKLLPDGTVQMAPNPDGAADPEVLVLTMNRPGGKPLAALFDYACHSRSLRSPNKLLSGDVLGIAEQVVETAGQVGVCAAFAGASGDVDPASVVDSFDSGAGSVPETVRLATLLGDEVLRTMKTAQQLPERAVVRAASARVGLPPKTAGVTKSVDMVVAAVGDVAFVGLDCEASVEIGLAIKAASPFATTFVITNCNGWVGYLPVARQYAEGGYEVSRSGFGPSAADVLVREVTGALTRLR